MTSVVLDFDGVLHSYITPWTGAGKVNDVPVEGVIKFLHNLLSSYDFRVIIFSTRNFQDKGISAMIKWLLDNGLTKEETDRIVFPTEKPAEADVFIDDRNIEFNGVFPSPQKLKDFKPWNKRK